MSRLDEIEERLRVFGSDPVVFGRVTDDCEWLIARVRELEEVLERTKCMVDAARSDIYTAGQILAESAARE